MRFLSTAWIVLLVVAGGQAEAQPAPSGTSPGNPIGISSVVPITVVPIAPAQDLMPSPFLLAQGKDPKDPKGKPEPDAPPEQPSADPFAAAAPEPAEISRGLNPRMIGDLPGYWSLRPITLPSIQIVNTFQTVTTFTFVPKTTYTATSLGVAAPGNAYSILDVLTVNGGTFTKPAQLQVTGTNSAGGVSNAVIHQGGSYTVVPANPVSTTESKSTGEGTGAKFTLSYTANTVYTKVAVQSVVPLTFQQATTVTTETRVLLATLGSVKIGENQSPMPEDRAFLSYNYFSGVTGPSGPFALPSTMDPALPGHFPTSVTTIIPGAPPPSLASNGGVFGIEKTLLGGNTSVGLRLPLFDTQGDGTFNQSGLGDLSVFFNYAILKDTAGDVLSGGLMVTLPTGPANDTVVGNIHPTILQPFAGYRYNIDRAYVQGFTSVAVPTDPRDVTVLFNDIGFGYYLFRDEDRRLLTAVIPAVEVHVTTPLNHRQPTDPVTVPDIVDLTAGVHIGLTPRSMFTIGVTVPVTGPRPFDVEGVAQLNFRF